MKNKMIAGLFLLLLLLVAVLPGCGGKEPAVPENVNNENMEPENQESEEPAPAGPRYGGVLRGIRATFPNVMSYIPEMSPTDTTFAQPYAEMLLKYDDGEQKIVPELAKSWEVDPENLTITFYLQEGVRFHDGTPFNAEAVKWNFELNLEAGSLTDGDYIDWIEVVDEHTLRIHVKDFTNQLYFNYGWSMMFSPTAFEKAGGGDREKSIEWARRNAVGTGPFKLVEFQRENYIRYERNDDYWREGLPYLDAIEIRYMPDPMTAKASLLAGEADIWLEVNNVEHVKELEEAGFKVNWGPGMLMSLCPSVRNKNSKWHDLRLREALEYAIDREALANMIGLGAYEPLHQLAVSDWPGYVPGYNPRPYDLEKAKALLAEAGYADGLETTILCSDNKILRDTATAIQGYLDAVGIKVHVDIADMGRYFTAAFAEGWDELLLVQSGINPDASDLFVHFGHDPMTFRTGDIYKSEKYLELVRKAIKAEKHDEFIDLIKQAVVQAGEDAMIIPLYRTRQACVMAPYVHSNYIKAHAAIWNEYEDWMEEH
ncbi:MAG: ABC transporter substrate-binding protein [Firmicutes bacterium]|nr:ABC transporter substrate-binding protein [Bacillota bacterium]